MCPDLIKKSSAGHDGQASDVWAVGVILFILVTGKLPFTAEFEADLTRRICSAKYQYPDEGKFLSNGCKHLIKRIFEPNAEKRITAAQILQDPWLLKLAGPEEKPEEQSKPKEAPIQEQPIAEV